ncbi:hypothetical protein Godav_015117 [Gossypium davidsonii]|uniref:DUF4283 domain-containing protein n=1 Tax=Gossypium davidsonii TaxID=34287 RepID=A0A7J8RNH9_GOSDV|nr:hypothetical protein [Gossypium davidsonii]
MEADLENLNLEDEEEGPILCTRNKITIENEHQVCLVGKALIDCIIHFPALKRTLADLWHPLGGVIISDLGDKRYLFKFFYEVDIKRVIDGIPWSFNRRHPRAIHLLRNKVRHVQPKILFLMETKLSEKGMKKVREKCGFTNGIEVGANGSIGGLSVGWKGEYAVQLRSFSINHIDMEILEKEVKLAWRLTGGT